MVITETALHKVKFSYYLRITSVLRSNSQIKTGYYLASIFLNSVHQASTVFNSKV